MNKFSIMAKGVMIAMSMVGMANADASRFSFLNSSLLNSWTGLYVGADAGVVFNNAQLKSQQLGFTNMSETCNTSSDFSSFFPGIQVGYLYQFPNYLVSGIEANVTVNTNQQDTLSCTCPDNPDVSDRFPFRNQMQTAIKARLGRALSWNNNIFLPYVTAGASFANLGLTYQNEGGDYYSNNTTQTGLLIGAGVEWAFRQHWSVRAEYYYIDYGKAIKLNIPSIYGLEDPNGRARINLSSNNIAVAINYWI